MSLRRLAVLAVLPAVALLMVAGVSLGHRPGAGQNSDSSGPQEPLLSLQIDGPSATEVPVEITDLIPPPPNREDCAAIQGTAYLSDEERSWFLANCLNTLTASGQYSSGERLVIPRIGVNAAVDSARVVGGVMPDPVSYFNVVWYDFGSTGLGGHPSRGGNTVLAGHVDSAVYGRAVFYDARNLAPGDSIEYVTQGATYRFVVSSVGDYLPTANWSYIVSGSAADLTLITCTGTFNTATRDYSHRRVVFARRI